MVGRPRYVVDTGVQESNIKERMTKAVLHMLFGDYSRLIIGRPH